MKHTIPMPTPSEIEAFRVSILLGLLRMVAVLAEIVALPRAWKQFCRDRVSCAERGAQAVIVLLACARRPAHLRTRTAQHPRSVRDGVRFKRTRATRRRRGLRIALRVSHRGTLAERIQRVIEALRDPEPHIARVLTLLADGFRAGSLVATAPPAITLAALAERASATFADSS